MSSFHVPIHLASSAANMASRPAATHLSNLASNSADVWGTGSGSNLPSGAISNSSRVNVSLHQPGSPAPWPAQPAHGAGFLVRLIVDLVERDALQNLARVGYFHIELGQHHLTDRHCFLQEMYCMSASGRRASTNH